MNIISDEIWVLQTRQVEHENHFQKKTEDIQGRKIRFMKARGSYKFLIY